MVTILQKGQTVTGKNTALIYGLKDLKYEERLKELGIWSLEERRNQADLLEVFKMKSGLSSISFDEFFEVNK